MKILIDIACILNWIEYLDEDSIELNSNSIGKK